MESLMIFILSDISVRGRHSSKSLEKVPQGLPAE